MKDCFFLTMLSDTATIGCQLTKTIATGYGIKNEDFEIRLKWVETLYSHAY